MPFTKVSHNTLIFNDICREQQATKLVVDEVWLKRKYDITH